MPVWHEATREWVKQGRLVLLGVTQEQHADRCRLFAQWKRFDWPILHDPINLLEAPAVPIVVAIDEHGIVRAVRPRLETFEADFLDKTFADDARPGAPRSAGPPDPASLRRKAEANPDAAAWRAVGDALTIWGGAERCDQAIDAYSRALALDASDKNALFRLGVAHRMRHESAGRRPGDFQAAIDAWGRALALDPNQYIWRRRIEQYGPRLAKPYAFYDWVVPAKAEISRRGETPVPLTVEPYGSELAGPVRDVRAEASRQPNPIPRGGSTGTSSGSSRLRWWSCRDASGPARPLGSTSPSARARPTRRAGTTNRRRCESGSPGPRGGRSPLVCSRRRRATSPRRLRSAASTSR